VPRCTRKELLLEDEDKERRDREEGYKRLGIELRRLWRDALEFDVYRDSNLMLSTGIL
jgi:hypothetical protein